MPMPTIANANPWQCGNVNPKPEPWQIHRRFSKFSNFYQNVLYCGVICTEELSDIVFHVSIFRCILQDYFELLHNQPCVWFGDDVTICAARFFDYLFLFFYFLVFDSVGSGQDACQDVYGMHGVCWTGSRYPC